MLGFMKNLPGHVKATLHGNQVQILTNALDDIKCHMSTAVKISGQLHYVGLPVWLDYVLSSGGMSLALQG